jgi:MOSC domain-containing protein YiiM
MELPWGMFGENFTVTGLREDEVRLGDRLRIGSAEFAVTQPRMPCYKLGMRFKSNDIIKKFLHSGRSGFYLAVLQEGEVEAGDAIHRLGGEEGAPSIAEMVRRYAPR